MSSHTWLFALGSISLVGLISLLGVVAIPIKPATLKTDQARYAQDRDLLPDRAGYRRDARQCRGSAHARIVRVC